MKKDRLESFISENRADLDKKVPSDTVWHSIRASLSFNRGARNYLSIWKVAAVVFFATSVILLVDKQSTGQDTSIALDTEQNIDQVESFYLSVIDQKKLLISDLSDRIILGDQAERDLYSLKAMYDVLKEEYKVNPTERVSDALILNLLVRIDILNDELQQVDDTADPSVSI